MALRASSLYRYSEWFKRTHAHRWSCRRRVGHGSDLCLELEKGTKTAGEHASKYVFDLQDLGDDDQTLDGVDRARRRGRPGGPRAHVRRSSRHEWACARGRDTQPDLISPQRHGRAGHTGSGVESRVQSEVGQEFHVSQRKRLPHHQV